jgi:hypothetical protein
VKKPVPDPAPPSVEGPPLVPLAEELAVPPDPVRELEAALDALLEEPDAPLVVAEEPPEPVLPVAASEVLAPVVLGEPLEPPPFDSVEWVLLHAAKHVAAATQDVARRRIMRSPERCKEKRAQRTHVLADLSSHAIAPARKRQAFDLARRGDDAGSPPTNVSLAAVSLAALQRSARPDVGTECLLRPLI